MRICCISQSVLADDPRVRKQVGALRGAGHDVVPVAYSGGLSKLPPEPLKLIEPWARSTRNKATIGSRVLLGRTLGRDPLAVFNQLPGSRDLLEAVLSEPADLYIANDWRALPAAREASLHYGARFAYDSHEWSVAQQVDQRAWRIVFPKLIDAIESRYIKDAAFVTTVGPTIARMFQSRYGLTTTPTVVRNLPMYEQLPLRPPGKEIRVLYHGQFLPNRCIESLVDSVGSWPSHFRLQLRGYGPASYVTRLKAKISAKNLSDRIEFLGMAAMTDLISLASSADIGIFVHQDVSAQARFALPNKLFEYMMAGLAICVSNLPEIAHIVQANSVGVLMDDTSPKAISDAMWRLAESNLTEYKLNSLSAAKNLNWEKEQHHLISLVETLHF